MEMSFTTYSETPWIELAEVKDGVKREVGVEAEEVEERVGRYDKMMSCLRFTRGSAICLIFCG